ncbi:hypothetical protein C3L33_23027, partial [Rhododendron williamsianum]
MRIFPRNFAPLGIGILFIFFTTFASAATLLPPDEVEALMEIGKTLGKTDWDDYYSVGADPCIIPPEWGSMVKLVNMYVSAVFSLLGNRLMGPIPKEFGNINTLGTLRLEFNQLSGPIPPELGSLPLLEKLVIQGSGLDGPIPLGIGLLTNLYDLRISDLNGSQASFPPLKNLTSLKTLIVVDRSPSLSINEEEDQNGADRRSHCRWRLGEKDRRFVGVAESRSYNLNWSSIYINCGGKEVSLGGNMTYEDDEDPAGPSKFYQSRTNWAFSSTGNFLDDDRHQDSFIWTSLPNRLSLKNLELYTDARISPISLTYYGFCLGKMVQKDFNIADEAGGIGKEVIKEYTTNVTDGTLEIRLYWAGKGTTGLPERGIYGPLISAISAISVHNPVINEPVNEPPYGISATAFVIILFLGILWLRVFLTRNDTMDQDGTVIAVKQLSSKSKQGNREFVNEIGMISALQHPHLVKLYGCCIEGNQLLLVYEYMENNSLARALFGFKGPEECQLQLDWPTRYKICIGIARGLTYLHEESRLKIVHRDIKATNVLLDKNLNPKISDFGLAKLDEEDNTHISTRIAGTCGYMAPEYAMRGYLTDKADVYSFGIVALEIVSGRSITRYRTQEDCLYLLDWALVLKKKGNLKELADPRLGSDFNKIEATVMMNVALLCANTSPAALVLKQKGNLMELVDPKLGSDFNKIEVTGMINVALMCTNVSPAVRPAMSSVVSMLEGRTVPKTSSVPDPDASNEQMKLKGMMIELQKSLETDTSEGPIQIVPTDGLYTTSSASAGDLYPYTGSSASAGDLYPYTASSASADDLYSLNWDSKVLENRYIR